MAKYIMSDLHGMYDKYIEMLNLINFTKDDKLYVLGDIFDRGENPIEILDHIAGTSNIHLLKGNHEKMFEEYFETGDISLWYYNGGQSTHQEIINKPYFEEETIYKYIKSLPYIKVVDNFILVHAGVYFPSNYKDLTIEEFINIQEEDICLWSRDNINNSNKIDDYTIICGHTPVQTITKDHNDVKILNRNGTFYIDCGACFKGGKAACLRLDDMEEYYV